MLRRPAAFLLLLSFGASAQETRPPVRFTKDVAPILYSSCASCHRPGEVAPFPLIEYGDVKKRAKQIVEAVESRRMPPWKPVEGHGEFVGDRRMKAADIELLRAWVDQGCVEGDAKDLPPPPKFPEGWAFGEPDLILKMPEPFTVPAEGRDIVRAFVVPLNFTESRYVRAFQYRPVNRRVVHHAVFFQDTTGKSRRRDAEDPAPGFDGWTVGQVSIQGGTVGSWTPGSHSLLFPEGMSREIRKNADLVMQIHFNPIGMVVEEQSQVGLWFTKEPPRRPMTTLPMFNFYFQLPAGEKDIRVTDKYVLPVDVDLFGLMPHAHYLAKECRIWAKDPQGKEIPLLWIKDWDFNWQEHYRYKEMIRLSKGTELNMVWTYDNTSSNPRNPSNPPRPVRYGERSSDEMASAMLHLATFNANDWMILYLHLLSKSKEK